MKKNILIAITIVIIILSASIGIFYWKQLRGVWPAVLKPQQNIVPLLETTATTGSSPLRIPEGFTLSIFAKGLNDPRVLLIDPDSTLLASIPSQGTIVALIDKNNDDRSDETKIVIGGLNKPHGIAIECAEDGCKLYIGETDKLSRYDYDPVNKTATNRRVIATLPGGGNHVTRSILPQGRKILVSVGSSCNVCRETDEERAKILEIDTITGTVETYATGLRNAVFMAIHPRSGELWATEMGRDLLGDNIPPDELNIVKKEGNYGWPICYGKNIHDTEFDKNTYIRNPCMEPFETPSMVDIPAHSAPLGLAFIPITGWPAQYNNDLLVAYHGSWNRSVPTGYKIVRHKFNDKGEYQGVEDFITGWINDKGSTLGRPVDIVMAASGITYISDDKAGIVYRLVPPTNK